MEVLGYISDGREREVKKVELRDVILVMHWNTEMERTGKGFRHITVAMRVKMKQIV